MIRARFYVQVDDYRPVNWPIKHPYWCTGQGEDYFVIVAYADDEAEILRNWPEADQIDAEECSEYTFTDRFPKPDWFKEREQEPKGLDEAVAAVVGQPLEYWQGETYVPGYCGDSWVQTQYYNSLSRWSPSTNPAQGHPLIERYGIALRRIGEGSWSAVASKQLRGNATPAWSNYSTQAWGPTSLVAAMRCLLLIAEEGLDA